MNPRRLGILLSFAAMVISQPNAHAQRLDRIRDRNGITTGNITKTSALRVTISRNGVESKKPVEEIVSITFADEPVSLGTARRHAAQARFQSALQLLEDIERYDIERQELEQEIDFLTTVCRVRLALRGQEDLEDARDQLTKFLTQHNKSFHIPEAIELLGDVLRASGEYEGALQQYEKLDKAPAPYFKTRSALLIARMLQSEGKHEQAVARFDAALQAAEGNTIAESQVTDIQLRRAVSQSSLGSAKAAIETVEAILSQSANDNDRALLAQAYNALGECYLHTGDSKAALHAFLHVDLVLSETSEEHAKALYQLSQLWDELGKPARARDARQRLKDQYPGQPLFATSRGKR